MTAIRPIRNRPTVGGVVGGILGVREEIENPSPGNPVGPIGRAVCNALATTGYDKVPLNNRTGPGFVCEPYWEDEGIDPPETSPPFAGGQCQGVQYAVVVSYNRILGDVNDPCAQGRTTFPARIVTGPVIGAVAVGGETERCGGLFYTNIDLIADGGSSSTPIFNGAGQGTVNDPRVESVTRTDGQPDDCGDPPPVTTPGPSTPGTPYGEPQPLPGYPGVDITVDAPITIGDGPQFYIPITISNDDGDSVGPPIFWTPDGIPPDLPPQPSPPIEPGDPQEPSEPSGDIPDDIPPEDEDEGVETIGYEWTLTGLPGNLSKIPGTSPAVLTTPYGNIQLRYEDSTGAARYSDNLPIRVVSGSIVRQDPRLTVKGVIYSRRPDIAGIRLVPLRARRM